MPAPPRPRLRLVHEGLASLRLERQGRGLAFDPRDATFARRGDLAIVLRATPGRVAGISDAAVAGLKPAVVAGQAVLDHLGELGHLEGHRAPTSVDGVHVDLLPVPEEVSSEGELRARALAELARPVGLWGRVRERWRLPRWERHVAIVTLPDGGRLAHLDQCVTRRALSSRWLDRLVERVHGVDWLLVGVGSGEHAAVLDVVPRVAARVTLVTELDGELRARGVDVGLLTPTVDRLVDAGLLAFPFPAEATQRFEA